MAVLKAYLDDSGDPADASHTYLTIAGYLSDEDGWKHFEPRWQAILDEAAVPYLHMREFGDPKSPIYGHLKANKEKESAFMGDLIRVIHESAPANPATSVCLTDLKNFNLEHDLNLDPYAVAIYGCLIQMRWIYPAAEIEVIFDKFDKSVSRAALAWDYAASDVFQEMNIDLFTPIPLQKEESWRDVLPLQAADFTAWEIRKFRHDHAGFKADTVARSSREGVIASFQEWKKTNKSRDRGSFRAMRESTIYRPLHVVMDQYALAEILERHPNGWGAR